MRNLPPDLTSESVQMDALRVARDDAEKAALAQKERVQALENERLAKEEAQRQLAEQLEVLNGEISVKDEVTTCSPSSCSFLRKDCATC